MKIFNIIIKDIFEKKIKWKTLIKELFNIIIKDI